MTPRRSLLPPDRRGRTRLATAVSLGYLLVVAVVFAFVLVAAAVPHPDASFAGVWLYFVTLPTSLLAPLVPEAEPWAFVVEIVLYALVQAAVLWLLVRGRGVAR